jgi:Holliday junction resolvase YEN1
MGVPGLWDVSSLILYIYELIVQLIRPTAVRTSLSTLARDAFYVNNGGLRALKIGIDASSVIVTHGYHIADGSRIWIFHAQVPMNGENPFLRTIFFKITALLQQPVLPVFVFGMSRSFLS